MTEPYQMADDLRFIRKVVERGGGSKTPKVIPYYWAAYVVAGYTLIDFAPHWANWVFAIGGIGGTLGSVLLCILLAKPGGYADPERQRRMTLHWFGGMLLVLAAMLGLAKVMPRLRGTNIAELAVVFVGVMYYLSGVHGSATTRYFMWAGPLIMAGAVGVGFLPEYRWTAIGVLIAVCIILPVFRQIPKPDGH
jgi:hypothetical protein